MADNQQNWTVEEVAALLLSENHVLEWLQPLNTLDSAMLNAWKFQGLDVQSCLLKLLTIARRQNISVDDFKRDMVKVVTIVLMRGTNYANFSRTSTAEFNQMWSQLHNRYQFATSTSPFGVRLRPDDVTLARMPIIFPMPTLITMIRYRNSNLIPLVVPETWLSKVRYPYTFRTPGIFAYLNPATLEGKAALYHSALFDRVINKPAARRPTTRYSDKTQILQFANAAWNGTYLSDEYKGTLRHYLFGSMLPINRHFLRFYAEAWSALPEQFGTTFTDPTAELEDPEGVPRERPVPGPSGGGTDDDDGTGGGGHGGGGSQTLDERGVLDEAGFPVRQDGESSPDFVNRQMFVFETMGLNKQGPQQEKVPLHEIMARLREQDRIEAEEKEKEKEREKENREKEKQTEKGSNEDDEEDSSRQSGAQSGDTVIEVPISGTSKTAYRAQQSSQSPIRGNRDKTKYTRISSDAEFSASDDDSDDRTLYFQAGLDKRIPLKLSKLKSTRDLPEEAFIYREIEGKQTMGTIKTGLVTSRDHSVDLNGKVGDRPSTAYKLRTSLEKGGKLTLKGTTSEAQRDKIVAERLARSTAYTKLKSKKK